MFLAELNIQEKEMFINLCMHAAYADGIFPDEERKMVRAYCNEMGMEVPSFEIGSSIEDILERVKEECSKKSKKIITLEILGLVLSDKVYDEKEKEFMQKVINKFGISNEELDFMVKQLNDYESLCVDIYTNLNK